MIVIKVVLKDNMLRRPYIGIILYFHSIDNPALDTPLLPVHAHSLPSVAALPSPRPPGG